MYYSIGTNNRYRHRYWCSPKHSPLAVAPATDLVPSDRSIHWVDVFKVFRLLDAVYMIPDGKLLAGESLVCDDALQVPHQVKSCTRIQAFVVKPREGKKEQTISITKNKPSSWEKKQTFLGDL